MNHIRNQVGKTKVSLLVGLVVGILGVFIFSLATPAEAANVSFPGTARNCDANAVVYCGALTIGELQSKYDASASVKVIYDVFGITSADIASLPSTAQPGVVTSSGEVIVNGQVVATNALTAGRENIPGSTAKTVDGVTFYERPPSVSFLSSQLSAYIAMNSTNQFLFAILSSCGNPVVARPVPPPATPRPAPPPTPTPTPTPAPKPSVAPVQKQQQQQQQSQTVIINQPVSQTTIVENTTNTTPAQTTSAPAPAPTQTQSLPNTGPGSIIGVFAGTTTVGTLVSHIILKRRAASSLL